MSGPRCLGGPALHYPFALLFVLFWFTSLLRRWSEAVNAEVGPNVAMHDVIRDGIYPRNAR